MSWFDKAHLNSYNLSTVTAALSYNVHIGQKSQNLYTSPVFDAPKGVPPSEFHKMFSTGKTRMTALTYAEESMMIC